MKIIETATLEGNVDMKFTGTASAAEGLCSENLNLTMATQNFSNMVAIQNRNETAEMYNLDCNMDVQSLASSTSTREDCPDMDDYDTSPKSAQLDPTTSLKTFSVVKFF